MMQTYLTRANPNIVRRVRQQKNGGDYLYFYTESARPAPASGRRKSRSPKRNTSVISWKATRACTPSTKTKYRFVYNGCRFEIDVYPFSQGRSHHACRIAGKMPPCYRRRPRSPSCARSPATPPTKTASWRKSETVKLPPAFSSIERGRCGCERAFRCASGGPFFSVLLE